MKSYFYATCKANVVGDGTVGATIAWLEKFINVLFPDNGIEYWSDNRYGKGSRYLKRDDRLPGAGAADECVHHVACYVRQGSCEGRIIEIALSLRGGGFKSLTWMKTFGKADECWLIARAIDEALNSIIFWEEVPELVSMSEKLPRQYNWHRQTSLTEEVTILSGTDKVLVSTPSGLILDDRNWVDQIGYAGSNATDVAQDWVTVLTNTNAKFKLVKDTTDRLTVPDLPGYVISKRGSDVPGFYVLPPGGNENDDRTYLGYFPDADAAIQASRDHQCAVSRAAIHARLDELTEIARSRRLASDGIFAATVGGADIDFMTPDEQQERHRLCLMLPPAAEEREAAKMRIQHRIAERKAKFQTAERSELPVTA